MEETKVLKRSESLLKISSPVYIVGDLHGNIFDLLRIFIHAKPPPSSRFLFLGDYVDRGEYSVEVLTLLFAYQVAYPAHIFLLRGNHEYASCNSTYGFLEEVKRLYGGSQVYDMFNDVFAWLPIAAIVGDDLFCVHGGLSPNMNRLVDFQRFKRPSNSYENDSVADILWSDPDPKCRNFEKSNRGQGYIYGTEAVAEFLEHAGCKKVIRAHQCVQVGVQKLMGDSVITVFSCSNYADAVDNRCGLLFVDAENSIQMFSMPPLPQVARASACLRNILSKVPSTDGQSKDSLAVNISMSEREQKRRNMKIKMSMTQIAPFGGGEHRARSLMARSGNLVHRSRLPALVSKSGSTLCVSAAPVQATDPPVWASSTDPTGESLPAAFAEDDD